MIAGLAGAIGVLGLLTVAPGPDMAVVTRVVVSGGRREASRTVAGVVCGLLVWGLVAVAGLAAVLAASASAYTVVRLAGAAYLVGLGFQAIWRTRRSSSPTLTRTARGGAAPAMPGLGRGRGHGRSRAAPAGPGSSRAGPAAPPGPVRTARGGGAWRAGFVTNLLNPKVGVFYTGVLPQLVPVGAPTAATQAGLVLAHAGLSLVWLNGYARAVGHARSPVNKPGVRRAIDRLTGVVLIGFGLDVALRAR